MRQKSKYDIKVNYWFRKGVKERVWSGWATIMIIWAGIATPLIWFCGNLNCWPPILIAFLLYPFATAAGIFVYFKYLDWKYPVSEND